MTTVAILGLGASGDAAARLALSKGGDVHVSDLKTDAATRACGAELRKLGAAVELGSHDVARIARAGTVVVSPGIPPHAPVLDALRARGVRWVSEPEFAARFLSGSLIGITGTNGKTTVSVLVAHLLREAGVRVGLGGNVGGGLAPAAAELALRTPTADWYVLELSSFQLADIDQLSPQIGVVTGLAPDHLDRYESVEAYYGDKARIFDNATADSRWVLNGEQPEVEALAGDAAGVRYRFGLAMGAGSGAGDGMAGSAGASQAGDGMALHAFLQDERLTLALPGEPVEPLIAVSELPLLGRHNLRNALCAALIARLAGVPAAAIAEGLRTARPLPHRLQPVVETDQVLWINDSKATNVAAAVGAVESLDRPLVLLLGGKDKGESLAPLVHALSAAGDRIRAVVAYGAAGARIAEALEGADGTLPEHVRRAGNGLDAAVKLARSLVQPGDALLLAPACSSFDEFENYEARGRRFEDLARGVAA